MKDQIREAAEKEAESVMKELLNPELHPFQKEWSDAHSMDGETFFNRLASALEKHMRENVAEVKRWKRIVRYYEKTVYSTRFNPVKKIEALESALEAERKKVAELRKNINDRPEKDGNCYYCKKPTDSLSGNPTLWPVGLCHKDDPGKVKQHHVGCVSRRLLDFEAERKKVVELEKNKAWHVKHSSPWKSEEEVNGLENKIAELEKALEEKMKGMRPIGEFVLSDYTDTEIEAERKHADRLAESIDEYFNAEVSIEMLKEKPREEWMIEGLKRALKAHKQRRSEHA